jgi:hypothetical protein
VSPTLRGETCWEVERLRSTQKDLARAAKLVREGRNDAATQTRGASLKAAGQGLAGRARAGALRKRHSHAVSARGVVHAAAQAHSGTEAAGGGGVLQNNRKTYENPGL